MGHSRLLRLLIAIVGTTLGVSALLALVRPMLALAPQLTTEHSLLADLKQATSLKGLRQVQQRSQDKLEHFPVPKMTQNFKQIQPYFTLVQINQRTHERLTVEQTAEATYRRAIQLADQAMATRQSGQGTLQALQQEEFLWRAAVDRLQAIPPDSLRAADRDQKLTTYNQILEVVAQKTDAAQSDFLREIAEETGSPQAVRISICHLSNECRHYRGDEPPASPASLIKLPIAVALMQKVEDENIDLEEDVYIDPHNWTENADGAKIFVDRTYPLREIMARMIKESNNTATNQLIDYIGWDEINSTLEARGFPITEVHSKLVGESTYPTYNMSDGGSNITTAHELTEMMRQIYTFQHPGDEEILDALVGQYDWDFGYQALQGIDRKRVSWIGEKTGQNSKVIGSTLAVKIDNQRYVMTVTLDYSGNQNMLRQVIRHVVQHILENGHFVDTRDGGK